MSYDLYPRNKKVKEYHIGGLMWPIMLYETGAGYVIGCGEGRTPASYVYQTGNNGSPISNDGYRVASLEAKMMAKVIRGFCSVQRFVNKEWEGIPEPQRTEQLEYISCGKKLYRGQWHEDRLKQLESFAEFAEASGGFTIN